MRITKGIHHVTAITKDAQMNYDFYTSVLGLRFVKRTVNQDDPGTYHLYYGNETGEPGTAITFFVWPHLEAKKERSGSISKMLFSIPKGSLEYWKGRLKDNSIEFTESHSSLVFKDTDDMSVSLEVTHDEDVVSWESSTVQKGRQIQRIEGVELSVEELSDRSLDVLNYLGYAEGDERMYHEEGHGVMDVIQGVKESSSMGYGSIHHAAFRVKDDEEQLSVRDDLVEKGFRPTPVIDRYYFKSVYFMLPEGILFEIATDVPGFTVDESKEELGSSLVLPPKFEEFRDKIEESLPNLNARRNAK